MHCSLCCGRLDTPAVHLYHTDVRRDDAFCIFQQTPVVSIDSFMLLVEKCDLKFDRGRSFLHLVLLRLLEVIILLLIFVIEVSSLFRLLIGLSPVDVLASGAAADDVAGVDLLHVVFVFFLG